MARGKQLATDCSKELDQFERYANIGLAIAEMRAQISPQGVSENTDTTANNS